jgi:hypothetical protein
MLHLRVGYRVESSNTNDFSDRITTTVVRVRICSQYPAEEGLKPQGLRSNTLIASLIDAIALQTPWYLHFDTHIEMREGIVTAAQTLTITVPMRPFNRVSDQ